MIGAACFVIFLWSAWCILCPSYNDGIVGKMIFIAMALSSLAVVTGAPRGPALYVLVLCIAAFGIRDFVIRHGRRFIGDRRARPADPIRQHRRLGP